MEDTEEYSTESLQRCSYRFLQQTAKALSLPSNVKKVYLIQLIHAKKYCSNAQVDDLVKQVRMERKHLALARKRAKNKKKHIQQSTEISSTSNTKSPPITTTPKRVSHIMIRYSPDQYSPPKRTNRNIALANGSINASDRVLRSFRSIRNPNYVLNNALIGIIKSSSSEESIKSIGKITVSTEDKYQQVNMTSMVKRNVGWRRNNEVMPVLRQRSANISPQPVKRERRLSGISPLNEEAKTPIVSIRRADGTRSQLNAYLQKPYTQSSSERKNREHSIHSIEGMEKTATISISSSNNFRSTTIANTSLEMSSESTLSYDTTEDTISNTSTVYKENQADYTVYYHKKIRAEQVRTLRTKEMAKCVTNECKLPKINDVFSNFNTVYERDVSQPIYVQVDSEAEMARNQQFIYPDLHSYQTTMLENLYNLKNVFIVNQPLLQINTTSTTRCVYSTPIISTAKAQPSANVSSYYNTASSQYSPHYGMEDARVHDFFKNFRCEEDGTTVSVRRSSSAGSVQSQDLGANVTIPEMVEDALELISQDGDYMERMGMDVRMKCILCDWAGPRIILEYHMRKEHKADIVQCNGGECVVRFTLGALASRRAWLSHALEHRHSLYVLSAKYQDPDRFAATLTALSNEDDIQTTGSITTYNKVTGEPFTWKGTIDQLPPTLTYENDSDGLKLELSRMDLLPNSANLKLLNRELVIKSPNKVVVGQPELDSICISLVVKLYD